MTYDSSVQHIGWSTYYRFIGVNRLVFTCITVFSALFAFSDIISRIPFCYWWRRPSSNRKVPCIVNFRDIAFSARSIVYMGKPTLQCIFSRFQCIHRNQFSSILFMARGILLKTP